MEVQWHQREAEQAMEVSSRVGRKWEKWRRKWKKWRSWETVYRWSSGYAEDYAWAGTVLGTLVVLFMAGYWLLGVPSEMQAESWWKRGLHGLLYSFQAGTLGRVGFYEEKVRLAARYLYLAESVLVPVQFGFFLFALRNRFRR